MTPGRAGALRASLRLDGGRTVAAELFSEVPLAAQRCMYYDEARPGMAHLCVASVSGGVLQGDRYAVRIAAGRGAEAQVTTQGATRIYGMDSGRAEQDLDLELGEGAYLEFVPDQVIPYRGSRFVQRARLRVHDTATLVMTEVLAPGRAAMGEEFGYDLYSTRTVAFGRGGALRLFDAAVLEPGRRGVGGFGAMGGSSVVGTAYVLAPAGVASEVCEAARGDIASRPGVSGGASLAAGGGGLVARVLGGRADAVSAAVRGVAARARMAAIGAPMPEARKA